MAHTSLRSQIRIALYSICRFGEKKHQYKKHGKAYLWIFYHPTYRKYVKNSWAVIKKIQAKHGINMLIKTRPWMVREEFERRINIGQSAWTIKAYKAALIKLERGIEHAYGYRVRLFPRGLKLPSTHFKARQGRFAYAAEETAAIIEAAYATGLPAAALLDLLAWTGLRLVEGLRLRARDIQGDFMVVYRGKGGRRREFLLQPGAIELVQKLATGKSDMDRYSLISMRQKSGTA